MATHSRTLAWKITQTEETGGLQSMGSQRVRHDWETEQAHKSKLDMQWKKETDVIQSCLTLWNPMDCRMPGFPVHHQLPELIQTHVHWVSDAIQPSHPLSSPSPPIFDISQHQGLFKWVSSSHQVAKVLEFQLQPQSFKWISLQPNKLCLKNLIKVDFISWVFNPILLATPADGREVWMIQSILAEGAFSQPDLRRSRIEKIQCEIRAACWRFRGSHTASADIFNPIDHTQWPSFLWQQSV